MGENETTVKHQSDDNIDNILICSIDAANLREIGLVNSTVFGDLIAPDFQ